MKCYTTQELLRYWQEKIPKEEKKEIEKHLYGQEDKNGNHDERTRCQNCFKKLSEIATPHLFSRID